MANLSITITQVTEQDYAGIDETTKVCKATIDSKTLHDTYTAPTATSDADCKTNFKAKLTAAGYTWDTET